MTQKSERQVVLADVDDDMANKILGNVPDIDGVSDAVLEYQVCDEYTTFSAKYGLREGTDIIISFFPNTEFRRWAELPTPDPSNVDAVAFAEMLDRRCEEHWKDKKLRDYWLITFPSVLNATAQLHFDATYPRLQAKYTEELKSWWVRAQGYGHLLDYERMVGKFFQLMDEGLDPAGAPPRTSGG